MNFDVNFMASVEADATYAYLLCFGLLWRRIDNLASIAARIGKKNENREETFFILDSLVTHEGMRTKGRRGLYCCVVILLYLSR